MNEHVLFSLFAKFMHVVKLSVQLEKIPRRFGTDEPLSSSEIRLIEIIGEKNALSVTSLAEWLNVTKGAVSQALKRLENKGLTEKTPDPENNSRSIIILTNKGKIAFYAHKHWHDTLDGGFKSYFESLEPEKTAFLHEFLDRFQSFLEKRIKTEQ